MAIVEVNHVTKEFRLGQFHSLRQSARDAVARMRGRPVPERVPFKALDDVDFKVEPGEVLGIIGQNGAGKSTLLKILARVSTPTSGSVMVRGSVAPLIEVGAGFVPELTGRENIYLNGSILGMPRAEIRKRFDEIVGFAELEQFIDTPIKRYSSGMFVRLGFALATSVRADILIVDEVLAVGDLAFQRKCFDRMEDMIKRQGKTVLLVSHNVRQLERICSRVILLDQGAIIGDGSPAEVCNFFVDRSNEKIQANQSTTGRARITMSDEIEFSAVDVFDENGSRTDSVEFLRPVRLRLTFKARALLRQITFSIGLHTTDFVYLTAHNTAYEPMDFDKGLHCVELEIKSLTLLPGVYCVLAWIGPASGPTVFAGENLTSFRVFARNYVTTRQRDRALFHMDATWNLDVQREQSKSRVVSNGGFPG
ncbi:MAG: ABC transporter ATP-binding protein [Acidobacteriia bacterium]|nr:ABC transporter ATP-binding protein [Terriglobia bacterium]